MSDLYETDFHAWAAEQADLLRAGKFADADMEHILEELEDMSGGKRGQLTNRLSVLLMHLLKWVYQPERRSRSWHSSVMEQRVRIDVLVKRNPSLKSFRQQALDDAYSSARYAAERETGIPAETFPATCPWTFDETMTLPVEMS
jgi:hypothetical protein